MDEDKEICIWTFDIEFRRIFIFFLYYIYKMWMGFKYKYMDRLICIWIYMCVSVYRLIWKYVIIIGL